MVLEISNIQDVKLQELAQKVDKKGNRNGKVDQEEIGQLLTQMTKNKYNFEDFKNLLGDNFENLSNEEKMNIYQNCHNELKDALQFADSSSIDGEPNAENHDILKMSWVSAAIGAGLRLNVQTPFSLKNILRGGAIGAIVGFGATALALVGDRLIYDNCKEKSDIKSETMHKLEEEMNKLQ